MAMSRCNRQGLVANACSRESAVQRWKAGITVWNGTTRRFAPSSEGMPVTITLPNEPSFIARLLLSLQHNW
jgi:hypothetical protein